MISTTYNEQNNALANDILHRNYYDIFNNSATKDLRTLSFIIDNQITKNHFCFNNFQTDTITTGYNNLLPFIQWYIQNDYQCNIELFGEGWQENLEQTHYILGLLLNNFGRARFKPKQIIIHGNCPFLNYPNLIQLWETYHQAFTKARITLVFRTYVNGLGLDIDDRLTQNFYEQYKFWHKTHLVYNTVTLIGNKLKNCLSNLDWWQQYFSTPELLNTRFIEDKGYRYTMDDINLLSQYYTTLFNIYLNIMGKEQLAKWIIEKESMVQLNPLICSSQDTIPCHCYNSLTIDLATLAVGLCPNLSNSLFTIGHYQINDGKITDFIADNVDILIVKDHLKRSEMPKCIQCLFAGLCPGTCLSCNYNESGNPIVPMYEVCMLLRMKYALLFSLVKDNNIIDEWSKINTIESQYLIKLCQEVNKNVKH